VLSKLARDLMLRLKTGEHGALPVVVGLALIWSFLSSRTRIS
jgi:hypothetical protein